MTSVVSTATATLPALDRPPQVSAEATSIRELVSLTIPLAAIWLLVRHFALESGAFLQLAALGFCGFAIHYFLPLRYRLPFFLMLSLAAIGLILGLRPAMWLIGMGLALIGLCHLPIPFAARVACLVAAGIGLAVMRAGFIAGPWSAAIWPVLGSMFMFRLVVYLYDLRHQPSLGSLWARLSYFFLLPNVCFPLFPVIDYSTFCRQYYNDERHRIHRIGVRWIFRGVLHLVAYRVVYQALMLEPVKVVTAVDLGRYLLWPFLLYLRVSGQFHVIVGMLRLFGFNLPETHHLYFLTSSFTDFWRRINIYWKDFMMKVFYYPAYFALRKRGDTFALVVSTALVFVVTWSLHAYQWFWIRGSFLLAWNDVMFWTILALFVVVNAVYERRYGRQRVLTRALTWKETSAIAARTIAMFAFISILWSLWSTESVGVWLSLWSAALRAPSPGQWRTLLVVLAVPATILLWAVAASRQWLRRDGSWSGEREAGFMIVSIACLVGLSTSTVYKRLGSAAPFIATVRFGGLNQADAINLERGYYENLMGVDRFNGELFALYMNRPPDWSQGIVGAGLARPAGPLLPYELVPSAEGRFKGARLRTNRWGMHDKEYDRQPAADCYRIALLGASHAMGSGVERSETFEAVLEDHLNQARGVTPHGCYEILNFAVYGYNPLNQIHVLENRVLEFNPRTILYVGHPEDSRRVSAYLAQRISKRLDVPYDDLTALARQVHVDGDTPERTASQRLGDVGDQILSSIYRRLIATARSKGVCAGFVLLPMIPEAPLTPDIEDEIRTARDAGFVMLNLWGVYDVPDRNALWIAEWDAHPNARAHRLVADRLYSLLTENKPELLSCADRTGDEGGPLARR